MKHAPTPITCDSIRNQLFLFFEKNLRESMVNAMVHHFDSCGECRLISNQVFDVLDEIQNDRQVPVSPFFIPCLLAKQDHANSILHTPFSVFHFPKLKPVFISAVILSGLLAGILVGNIGHQKQYEVSRDKISRSTAMKIYADEALVSDITNSGTDNLLVLK